MAEALIKRSSGWLGVIGLLSVAGLSGCGMFSSSAPSSGLLFPEHAAHTRPATPVHGGDFIDRVAVNPFDPIALNNLAIAEASKGRYQQALMLLQRAVKLAPARPDIAANLQSLQRWLVLAEGQAAIGAQPQPLALPYQDSLVPEVPPLWQPPPSVVQPPSRPAPVGALPPQRQPSAVANPPPSAATPRSASPTTNTKTTPRPLIIRPESIKK